MILLVILRLSIIIQAILVSDSLIVQAEGYTTDTETHPNMYLNTTEIEYIKEKVMLGQEPWNTSYYDMSAQAVKDLRTKPKSVVTVGKVPPSGDLHDYYTDDVYISDGIINQSADREDYYVILNISRAVRYMGLLYAFTGNSTYANHSIKLINAWTVDPSTRMNPNYTNRQSRYDLITTLPPMFYGADLIYNYSGWNQSDKETFKQWTRDMIVNTTMWNATNNFENWRLVLISSASVVAEDTDSRQYAFDRWKEIMRDQMNNNGSFKYELSRKDSLTYSTLALNGMIQTAEIAQHNNVDLYNYELLDGRGLEMSLDFHVPYITSSSKWNFSQNATYKGENTAIYELAYAFKQKPLYWQVIEKWKRPMYENKVLASITLTHGVEMVREDSIITYYRNLNQYHDIVETNDLLKAAQDWRDEIIPPGLSVSIATNQLLILADEWKNS